MSQEGIRPVGAAEADLAALAPQLYRGELVVTVDNSTDKNPQRLLVAKASPTGATDYIALAGYDLASDNVFIGNSAGSSNTTGTDNTFIGDQAGAANTTNSFTVYVGSQAGQSATGQRQVALGYQALKVATGDNNVAIGFQSGQAVSSGINNTYIGFQAGLFATSGSRNTFIGTQAARNATTVSDTICFGSEAMAAGTPTGSESTALGSRAMYNISSAAGTTGLGYQALYNITTAGGCTAVGRRAGFTATGSFSTFMGYNADVGSAAHSTVICLGAGATSTQNNELVVGDNSFPINHLRIGEQTTGNPLILGSQARIEALGYLTCNDSGAAAQAGDIRYNTGTNKHEGYDGTSWNAMY